MVGRSDLVMVPGSVWNANGHFLFAPKNEDDAGSINQTYIRDDRTKNTIFHGVYLNFLQMRRIWPSIELKEATEDIR